jgi:hypothetical protein
MSESETNNKKDKSLMVATEMDMLFSVLLGGCFIVSAYLLYQINIQREFLSKAFEVEFKNAYQADKNYWYPSFTDLWISAVVALAWFKLENPVKRMYWGILYKYCKEQENENIRIFRTEKAARYLYKALFYFGNVVFAYCISKDTDFLIPQLGGKAENSINNIWRRYPVVDDDYSNSLKLYYLVSFGYHSSALLHLY